MNKYTPKYVQIEKFIMKNIKSGKYKIGMKIPSEIKLAEKFNVSRVTASKAMNELSTQGIVERIQGKGTYVSNLSKLNTGLYHNTTKSVKISSEDAESRLHKIVNTEKIKSDNVIMSKLSIDKYEEVFKITRFMLKNDKPMAIDTSYIPSKYMKKNPDFSILDRAYLHEFLEIYNGVKVGYLHIHIDAKLPNDYEKKILNVDGKQPLVIWDTSILDKKKKVIALTTSIAHPKKYRAYINFEL